MSWGRDTKLISNVKLQWQYGIMHDLVFQTSIYTGSQVSRCFGYWILSLEQQQQSCCWLHNPKPVLSCMKVLKLYNRFFSCSFKVYRPTTRAIPSHLAMLFKSKPSVQQRIWKWQNLGSNSACVSSPFTPAAIYDLRKLYSKNKCEVLVFE